MRQSAKLSLTALIAALLLSAALSTASARNLSFSSQTLRATWRVFEFESAFVFVRCTVTLEGSFHSRTIPKVERLLVGAITRVTIKNETCTNGMVTVTKLPWHYANEGFSGTLPAIVGLLAAIAREHFVFRTLGLECGYGAEEAVTVRLGLTAGEATEIEPIAGRNALNRTEGSGFCPPQFSLVGRGGITVLNSSARVRLTLI